MTTWIAHEVNGTPVAKCARCGGNAPPYKVGMKNEPCLAMRCRRARQATPALPIYSDLMTEVFG